MKKVLAFTAVSAAAVLAGDVASFEILGFSRDGSLMAWMEHGTQDGSGFDYCNAYVIETAHGSVLAEAEVVIDPYDTSESYAAFEPGTACRGQAVEEAMRMLSPVMTSLGIEDSTACVHAVSHPLTDLGVPWDRVVFDTVERADAISAPGGGILSLSTSEVRVDSIFQSWCFNPFLLRITLSDRPTGESRIIYSESALEPGREYRQGARIGDVYTLGDTLVVAVLDVVSLGFEGSDVRHMVVTGNMSFVGTGW
ncbi:DUF2259 domain-containing protein [Candidatus Fermentibacteria bacterium]|nr:DUF2259 domain-containing protein [Candidatus Fermentibacteria bacterium]